MPSKYALSLLVALFFALAGCAEPARFYSNDITGVDWGRDFTLTDPAGQPRRLADFRGKAVLLSFGYTHCPDICPTTLVSMRDTLKHLGADANRIQVLFVTLDPARDTPAVLGQYVPWFDPGFLGLWGDEATIAALARDYKIFYAKQPGKEPGSYSVDHSASSYAFDPAGRLRLIVRHGEAPEHVAADLKLLLAGK